MNGTLYTERNYYGYYCWWYSDGRTYSHTELSVSGVHSFAQRHGFNKVVIVSEETQG